MVAAAGSSSSRRLQRGCPEARLAGLVPKEFYPGQVLYLSPAVTDPALAALARSTVGAQPLPRAPEGDEVDRAWQSALPVFKSPLVIFIEPTAGSQAHLEGQQTFESGSASFRFVVSERESGAPLCAGSFFAASSGQVWVHTDSRRGETDVGADLSRNSTESFRRALAALSKSLAFESIYPQDNRIHSP